jgi:general secretion pathway protein A
MVTTVKPPPLPPPSACSPTTPYDRIFSFFGLRENPFHVSPDLRFLFSTHAHESALAELLFAIQTRQGLIVLTGESGTGKTTLLRRVLDTLQHSGVSSSYVFHPRLDTLDFLEFVLEDFGVPYPPGRKGEVLQALHHWLLQRHQAGDTPVAIVDEAQALRAATLDELRLLLNLESAGGKLMQIVLAGQPELEEKLRRPELRQLRQRVMFRCHLPRLTLEETSAYMRSRLEIAGLLEDELFPCETVREIYHHSKGIPRTINLLGEHAIINAYSNQKRSVSPEDICQIASDFDLVENPLKLGKEDDFRENNRLHHFPVPTGEGESLSSLGSSLEQPVALNAPAIVDAPKKQCQGLLTKETLSRPAFAAVAPGIGSPAPLPEESGVPVPLARPNPPKSIAATHFRANSLSLRQRNIGIGDLPKYWKNIVVSFLLDARALYSVCARFLCEDWQVKNRRSPKRPSVPV